MLASSLQQFHSCVHNRRVRLFSLFFSSDKVVTFCRAMSLQRIIFASVALTMLCVRSSHAQFAYPGAFPSMYQPSPRMPWAPLPYGRSPFIPPMSFGASPAASSLMPSSLYAPSVAAAASAAGLRRPHPMSPFASPYAPASPSAGPGLAFGSSFAASYPVSAFAPAPMSPISPIAPSPFPMPSASSFSGVRFGSSSRPLQVTKLDDL